MQGSVLVLRVLGGGLEAHTAAEVPRAGGMAGAGPRSLVLTRLLVVLRTAAAAAADSHTAESRALSACTHACMELIRRTHRAPLWPLEY